MNTLSWLIYAADVTDSLNGAAWLSGVVLAGGAAGAAALVRFTGERAAWDEQANDHKRYPSLYRAPEGDRPAAPQPLKAAKPYLWLMAASIMVGVVAPSRDTIYAIAASESSEALAKTPTVTKAVKALDAWLDKQIAANSQ